MSKNILFICLLAFTSNLFAQRFSAGIVGGMNASTLDVYSDGTASGLNLGLVGAIKLVNRFDLSTEILWSRNGEYITPSQYAFVLYNKVRLDYVEIPIQLIYQMRPKEEENYHHGWLRMGIAYSRLINHRIEVQGVESNDLVVWDKRDAFLINFGGVYFFNPHWGINCRMSFSTFAKGMGPTFAFRGMYIF